MCDLLDTAIKNNKKLSELHENFIWALSTHMFFLVNHRPQSSHIKEMRDLADKIAILLDKNRSEKSTATFSGIHSLWLFANEYKKLVTDDEVDKLLETLNATEKEFLLNRVMRGVPECPKHEMPNDVRISKLYKDGIMDHRVKEEYIYDDDDLIVNTVYYFLTPFGESVARRHKQNIKKNKK